MFVGVWMDEGIGNWQSEILGDHTIYFSEAASNLFGA